MTGRPWDPRDELSRQDEPIPNATGVTPPYGFPPREQRVDTRHAADGLGAKQQALTPGTDFQIEGIGFDVRSIAIDNPSGGWWYVVNAGAWVPPYWVGRIFTVIPSQNVRILSSAPGGFTQGYQAGEQAMATFYDAEIGPDDGEQIEGPAGSSDLNVTIVGPLDTPSDENANMAGVATAAFNKVFDPSLGGAGLWTRMRQVVGDAVAKTGLLAVVGMGWNGATYDRLKSTTAGTIGVLRIAAVSGNVDGDAQGSGVNSMMNDAGVTVFPGFVPYGYNGATKDRLRAFDSNNDNLSPTTVGILQSGARLYGFDGEGWDRIRVVDTLKSVALSDDGTIWDPAPGKAVRLFGVEMVLSPAAARAAGAIELTVGLEDGGANIGYTARFTVPAAAAPTTGQQRYYANFGANGRLLTVDNNLTANFSALIDTAVQINVWGVEE